MSGFLCQFVVKVNPSNIRVVDQMLGVLAPSPAVSAKREKLLPLKTF
ncbi:MAG TPA: hypothetical protein VLN44_02340 [Pyrinomonadaceae bacterium]|nr:hypothetical protein [Pyrinomonadaceae bacterium]